MPPKITQEDIAKIASYILQGLTQDEACIVSDIDPADFKDVYEKSPSIQKYIKKANINFKLAHLKAIQAKKSGNNSQWILEKILPKEFGSKSNNDQTPINIISQIIQNIQNGEQNSKLAPTTRGELLIEESEIRDIESALR